MFKIPKNEKKTAFTCTYDTLRELLKKFLSHLLELFFEISHKFSYCTLITLTVQPL